MKLLIRSRSSLRLAATYLAIIMVMSIGFSIVFYKTSAHELGRQAPPRIGQQQPFGISYANPRPQNTTVDDFLAMRAREGRSELLQRLVAVNIGALVIGATASYYLARRALRPIEAAMDAQAEFVSNASHELRTPLTALQATNEVALRNRHLALPAAKELIAGTVAETVKLQRLATNLLDLAKQDGQRQQLHPVAVQDAASQAINQVLPLAQAKHIIITDELAPVIVMAQQSGLVQLLVILLENAIKYGKTGGTILLQTATKGRHVSVQVIDNGIGIAAKDIAHVFERFYRADDARNDGYHQGYGLGLAIAKNLAAQSNGSIIASSQSGIGTTMTITLKATKL